MLRRLVASALVGLLAGLSPSAAIAAPSRTVIIVVDASGSMSGGGLRMATDATRQLMATLDPTDVVSLYTFSDGVPRHIAPTANRADILATLRSVHAAGDTAFLDTVVDAASSAPADGPCALLILSDGTDRRSNHSVAEAQQAIRTSGCTIAVAAVAATRMTRPVLAALAAAGHGDVFSATGARAVADRLTQAVAAMPTPSPTASTAATPTTSPTAVPSTTPPAPEPTPTTPGPLRAATVLLVGIMTTAAAFLFLMLLGGGSDRAQRRRMERLIQDYAIRRVHEGPEPEASVLETLEDAIHPLLVRSGRSERLMLLLEGAAVQRSAEQWVLIQVGIGLGVGLLTEWFTGLPIAALVLAALGAIYPGQAWLSFRRRRRSRSFEEGLPDALLLIASSLRSGFALDQAISAAGDQADSAVSTEFRRAVQEVRIGVPLEDALDHAAQRIDSADFAWVVTALRIQRRTGGNLAETLVTVARTVRQRAELGREVKALTAEGRMSTYVLMALPIGLFGFLMLTQPSYLAPLWSTPTGLILSGIGIVMLIIGWLLMQRLIRVDV